jgi:hypothetical protein
METRSTANPALVNQPHSYYHEVGPIARRLKVLRTHALRHHLSRHLVRS